MGRDLIIDGGTGMIVPDADEPTTGSQAMLRNAPPLQRRSLVPPGTMIPSGRWWVYIEGAESQFGVTSVNGQQFYFPQGDWIVLDETNFYAAVNSRLRMFWLDGMELWEKVIEDQPEKNLFNVIVRRKVSDRPERDMHHGYHRDHDARMPPEQQRRLSEGHAGHRRSISAMTIVSPLTICGEQEDGA